MKINEILAAIEWVEEWIHRNGLINIKLIFRIQIFSPRDAFYFDAINQCAQVFELPKKPVCSPQLFSFFSVGSSIAQTKTRTCQRWFSKKKHTEEIKEFVRLALDFHAFIIPNDLIFVVKNPRQYWLGFYLPRKLANNLQDAKKNLLSRSTFGSSTWTRNRIFEHKIRMKYRRENSDSM